MNVIASSRNTIATAPVVRSDAKNIRDVKIPHVHRYRPITLVMSLTGTPFSPTVDQEVERDPERAVGAERDRSERVAGPELPDAGDQLGDATVGQRQAKNAGQRIVVDQVGVDHAEHERGRGEPCEPERRRVRRDPPGGAAGVGIGCRRGGDVRFAPAADVCGFHLSPPDGVMDVAANVCAVAGLQATSRSSNGRRGTTSGADGTTNGNRSGRPRSPGPPRGKGTGTVSAGAVDRRRAYGCPCGRRRVDWRCRRRSNEHEAQEPRAHQIGNRRPGR